MTTHNATTAATATETTGAKKKGFFESLFPKKEEKKYDPYILPNGTIINGPMADHFRAMISIGRAYDPFSFDESFKNALTTTKPEEKKPVAEGPKATKAEREAIVKAVVKTQPETGDEKPIAEAIVEGLSAAVAEDNASKESVTSKPASPDVNSGKSPKEGQ